MATKLQKETTQLKKAENAALSSKQPAYNSSYADMINSAIADTGTAYKDANTNYDNLYKNYRDEYMSEAQKAKVGVTNYSNRLGTNGKDTGYAQSVSDQQYQQYLTEMNRMNPVFENLAYQQYQGDMADAYKRAGLYADLDNFDYGMYRDRITDAQNFRNYQFGDYKNEASNMLNYQKIKDNLDTANKNYQLNKWKDQMAKSSSGGSGGGYPRGGNSYTEYPTEQQTEPIVAPFLGGTTAAYLGLAGISALNNLNNTAVNNTAKNLTVTNQYKIPQPNIPKTQTKTKPKKTSTK